MGDDGNFERTHLVRQHSHAKAIGNLTRLASSSLQHCDRSLARSLGPPSATATHTLLPSPDRTRPAPRQRSVSDQMQYDSLHQVRATATTTSTTTTSTTTTTTTTTASTTAIGLVESDQQDADSTHIEQSHTYTYDGNEDQDDDEDDDEQGNDNDNDEQDADESNSLSSWSYIAGNSCILVPQPLQSLSGKRIVQLACGTTHNVALSTDGDVYTWGWNWAGQIGHADAAYQVRPSLPQSLTPSITHSLNH
jgi:hypothetical protein